MFVGLKKNISTLDELILSEVKDNITINDDNWQCIVTMLVETSKNQVYFTSILNKACEKGYRKAICLLNRNQIFNNFRTSLKSDEKINELVYKSKSDKISTQKIRQYFRDIFQANHDTDKSLPHNFEAALVKWMIYENRLKYLEIIKVGLETKIERDQEFIEMQKESRKYSTNDKTKVKMKTVENPRVNSRLKTRDKEWENTIYMDDAPMNGPNSYILLTGFHNPELPLELIKIGVPLYCILRLDFPQLGDDLKESRTNFSEFENRKSISPLNSFESLKLMPNSEPETPELFWNHFDVNAYCDLSVRCYCPPPLISDKQDLYNNISYVLYDFYEIMQDHSRYLNSMKIYHVFEPRDKEQSICIYKNLLRIFPEESISIPVILEALLRQIEENLEEENNFEKLEDTDEENVIDNELLMSYSPKKQESAGDAERHTNRLSATSIFSETTSLSEMNSTPSVCLELKEKLHLFNLKYELISQPNESSEEHLLDPELILHGDSLRLNAGVGGSHTRRKIFAVESEVKPEPKSNFRDFENFQVKLIEDPRISEAWCNINENEVRNCKTHLLGIFKHCEKQGLHQSKTNHLLNIGGIQKLIETFYTNCNYSEKDTLNSKDEKLFIEKDYHKINSNMKSTSYIENKSNFKENINEKYYMKIQIKEEKSEVKEAESPISLKNKDSYSDCGCYSQSDLESTLMKQWNQSLRKIKSSESFLHHSYFNSATSIKKSLNNVKSTSTNNSFRNPLLRSFENCSDLFSLIDMHKNLKLALFVKKCPILDETFKYAELIGPNAFLQIVQDCFQIYEDEGFITKYFLPTDSLLILFCNKPHQPSEIIEQHVTNVLRTPISLHDFCDYILEEETEWLERQRKFKSVNELLDDYRNVQMNTHEKVIQETNFRDEDFLLKNSLKALDFELLKQNENRDSFKESKKISHQEKLSAFATFSSSGPSETNENLVSPLTPKFNFIGYDVGERHRVQVSRHSWTFESTDGMRARLIRETWLLGSNKNQKTTSVRLTIPGKSNETLRYHESEFKNKFTSYFNLTMGNGIILALSKLQNASDNVRSNKLLYEIQISWPTGLIVKPVEYTNGDFPFYILQYHSKNSLQCKTIKVESHRKYLHNGDVVKFFNDSSIIILRPNGTIITILDFEDDGGDSVPNTEETKHSLLNNSEISKDDISSYKLSYESNYFSAEYLPRHYTVVESDGRHYEVWHGSIVNELQRLRVSCAETYSNEEKFIRRDDGTDMIINNNAEVFVTFSDGTRMQSSCLVENDLLHCEWSEKEIQRYFYQKEPEGFVSVVTYSRAEHPNYATVSCEPPSVGTYALSIGKNFSRLRLKQHGFGEISINNKLRLEFVQNKVLLTRECPCHGATSTTTFHLIDRSKTFNEENILLTFKDNTNHLMVRRNNAGFSKVNGAEVTKTTYCGCQKDNNKNMRCRIFALNRNGQAYEYHYHSTWQKYIERISQEDRLSLIRSDDGDIWLSLEIPESINNLINTSAHYQIPEAKPSDKYRPRLEEDEAIWDQPFKATNDQPIPYLKARILKNIVQEGEKSFENLQKALIRYWKEIATGVQESEYSDKDTMTIICECQDEIVSQIMDIASGKMKTIDRKIYESGLQYAKELKIKRDEEWTRQIINQSYFEKDTDDEYQWLNRI